MEREIVEDWRLCVSMFETDAFEVDFAFLDFEFFGSRYVNHVILSIENNRHLVRIAEYAVDMFKDVIDVPKLAHNAH